MCFLYIFHPGGCLSLEDWLALANVLFSVASFQGSILYMANSEEVVVQMKVGNSFFFLAKFY